MQNLKSKFAKAVASTSAYLAGARAVFAQSVDIPEPDAGFTDIGQLINNGLNLIFIVAGLAVLVYLFFGGFTYLTAGDDTDKTASARKQITNAVVGLAIVGAAFVAWQIIINIVPGLNELLGQ